jgi:hypothetical protein
MAHHVATMSSQIVPLSNKTTMNNDKAASSTLITICVIDMIILTVGYCLVTKTAVTMVAVLSLSVPC